MIESIIMTALFGVNCYILGVHHNVKLPTVAKLYIFASTILSIWIGVK